eukprot:2222621-Rhodomonas_salina.2
MLLGGNWRTVDSSPQPRCSTIPYGPTHACYVMSGTGVGCAALGLNCWRSSQSIACGGLCRLAATRCEAIRLRADYGVPGTNVAYGLWCEGVWCYQSAVYVQHRRKLQFRSHNTMVKAVDSAAESVKAVDSATESVAFAARGCPAKAVDSAKG